MEVQQRDLMNFFRNYVFLPTKVKKEDAIPTKLHELDEGEDDRGKGG